MSAIDVVTSIQPAELGEGPLWSALERCLYWVDIDGRRVHRYDPSTDTDEHRELATRPGSLALSERPGVLLVATEHFVGWFDWATGALTPIADLEEPGGSIRLNDGRTDPAGRFIVGSMYVGAGPRRFAGSLHQLEANGTHTALRRAVGVSNGLAFDAVRSRMYWADTSTQQVLVWDYDTAEGQRRNERVFFDYNTAEGKPDGACVDADGYYWSASVRGWGLLRLSPDGTVERRIELPVELPTMPCFGGPDLSTLFVTSIRVDDADEQVRDRRRGVPAGSVLAIDLSNEHITGVVDPPFAGQPT